MKKVRYYFFRLVKMDFKAWFKAIQTIHELTHINRVYLLFDMILSSIKYGTGYVDYSEFEFYLLKPSERETYLTTSLSDRIAVKYNDKAYLHYHEDKGVFAQHFKDYLGREIIDLRVVDYDAFISFTQRHDRFFVKTPSDMSGVGITYYETRDISDLKATYDLLLKNNQIVVEEFFKQHPEMNKLSLKSVNTIRMITFLDDDHIPRLLVSALKGGTDKMVDNIGMGGMYTILSDEGEIIYPMIDYYFNRYTIHPNTQEPLIGFKVPMYDAAIEMVKEAALKFPQVRYVGWDVAIGENGPCLIEGNANPGPFQVLPSLSENKTGILPIYKKYMSLD